jgi:hypothetical protein
MTGTILWSYRLQVRSVDGSGTQRLLWTSADDQANGIFRPIRCGPLTYEPILEDREALDYSQDDVPIGYRKHLIVRWQQIPRSVPAILGASGGGRTQSLAAVFSDAQTLGYGLQVSLTLTDPAVWRWVKRPVARDYENSDGKNTSLALEIEFIQRTLSATEGGVADTDW